MKNILLVFLMLVFIVLNTNAQINIKDKIKNKSAQRAEDKADQGIDKGLDKAESVMKKKDKSSSKDSKPKNESNDNQASNADTTLPPGSAGTSFKTYQNYDFVPGDRILFEDNFLDDTDGEFATHWELKSGQAVLNKINDQLALHLTDGNYARVNPRMKTESYLTDPFTIEYDYYFVPGAYGIMLMLKYYSKEDGFEKESYVQVTPSEVQFSGKSSFVKTLPDELKDENFWNKWHHVAIAYKNHQLKVYVDQYRVLVVPDTKENYEKFEFAGIGQEKLPIIFKNVRLASGGNMNMIGKKFTDSKIVTHGINFDYNKATLKPESMGTLNMIVKIMHENADLKFEIGGHSDGDGEDAYNLKLSQQRADAVRDQLIKLGIETARLTAKGYGESQPISDNTSPEGKANNRRVEFVKK